MVSFKYVRGKERDLSEGTIQANFWSGIWGSNGCKHKDCGLLGSNAK
jgi:hypothetical protein